jgi:hypothetical protein
MSNSALDIKFHLHRAQDLSITGGLGRWVRQHTTCAHYLSLIDEALRLAAGVAAVITGSRSPQTKSYHGEHYADAGFSLIECVTLRSSSSDSVISHFVDVRHAASGWENVDTRSAPSAPSISSPAESKRLEMSLD